jgi:hypothetical protein
MAANSFAAKPKAILVSYLFLANRTFGYYLPIKIVIKP